MDFTMTEAQTTLAGLTREIVADRKPLDGFDKPLWTDLARAGVLAAALPAAAGGDDLGLLEQCSVLHELGRAALGLPYLVSVVGGASAIARFGSPDQVESWAAPAGRGELVLTVAPTEAVVRREGGSWVLDGECLGVPAAPDADAILVPTSEGLFIVAAREASIEAQQVAGGPGAGAVELSGVEVGADRRLADPAAVPWVRDRITVGLCATQAGVLERALELTAEHARSRVQFGKPIGSFQAVAQRLADAYIDVEAVRLTLWQAAWRLSAGLPCSTELATAAFWAADAGHRVAHTAVHVHGGIGIDLDHIVRRYFLAAKYLEFTLAGATGQLLALGACIVDTPLDA
jgi:acyl-CoA dehydrogenase